MLNDLGIKSNYCQQKLEVLNELRNHKYSNKLISQDSYYLTSSAQIRDLYGFLADQNISHSLASIFTPKGFIKDLKIYYGQFSPIQSCIWHDPTNLFVKYKSSLENLNILKDFYQSNPDDDEKFIKSLGIKQAPEVDDYIRLLDLISSLNESKSDSNQSKFFELVDDLYKVFNHLVKSSYNLDKLKEQLNNKRILPCFDQKFYAYNRINYDTNDSGFSSINVWKIPVLATDIDLARQLKSKFNFIVFSRDAKLEKKRSK